MTRPQKSGSEGPVPDVWRPTFIALVESLAGRDVPLAAGLAEVDPVADHVREQCLPAVDSHGDADLAPLQEETWQTSVTAWQGVQLQGGPGRTRPS